MKILSIHAQDFGKLHNVDLDLRDGVNVIGNVNGFGKTTMASFIRAMLFGFQYRVSGGVRDNSRFAPWQGAVRYGGSMTVSHGGETYRIERFFGATAKNETLTFTNDKTGKPVDLQGMQPGEFLLGLTADSYDRSAYFPQEAVELSSNDNFDARLANLIENGAEDYDKIQEKLRAYKKQYRYEKGSGGKIFQLECERVRLLQKQRDEERAERRSVEIEKSLVAIDKEKQALLKQQEENRRRQAALQREVVAKQPSPEEQRAAERLAELEEKLRRVPAEFDADVQRCDEIEKELANLKDDKPARKLNKLALLVPAAVVALGIILAALGAVATALIYVGVALIVLGAGAIGVEIFLWQKSRRKSTDAENKKEELISRYVGIVKKYVYVDGADVAVAKQRMWDAHEKYKGDARERDTLRTVVRPPSPDSQKAQNALDEVNGAITATERRLNALSEQLGELNSERKTLAFDTVAVQDELMTVADERARAEFEYEVADTVSRLLAEAKDNLSASYLPKLAARCGELLCDVTQSKYEVVVDRTFNVKIREQGVTREMNFFSRGIREITLLCFRVALSELLYDGDIPFIIIDDAFVNFDEPNFLRATQLLKRLSKCAQVVYFTCHDRRGELK